MNVDDSNSQSTDPNPTNSTANSNAVTTRKDEPTHRSSQQKCNPTEEIEISDGTNPHNNNVRAKNYEINQSVPQQKSDAIEEMREDEEDEEDEDEIDEDEWREEFKEILDNIDRKGDFCIGNEVTTQIARFSPQITIDGMDDGEQLTFPLMDYQAKRLRSFSEKAPFGKGMDTVLDESIRKAWQIDADKVKFYDFQRWGTALKSIVSNCTASLGMSISQQGNVQANLYKLLLYEPGGHFKKHRDTEKEPGMNMF